MNPFGILIGFITLLIIGLGFPLVIFGERWFGVPLWFYMLKTGVLIVLGSLFIQNDWLCVIVAVIGATFIWGSTELKEQAVRAKLGWFPLNPNKIRVPFAELIEKWKAPHL